MRAQRDQERYGQRLPPRFKLCMYIRCTEKRFCRVWGWLDLQDASLGNSWPSIPEHVSAGVWSGELEIRRTTISRDNTLQQFSPSRRNKPMWKVSHACRMVIFIRLALAAYAHSHRSPVERMTQLNSSQKLVCRVLCRSARRSKTACRMVRMYVGS